MTRNRRPAAKRLLLATGAAIVALSLASCASDRNMTTGSVSRSAHTGAGMSLDQLGQAYVKDTRNGALAMRYAEALQAAGQTDQSLAVMRKAAIDFPNDRTVLAAYGKALAAAGELEPALDAVRRAQTPEYPDWRLMSAEAAILDQLNQTNEARALYRRALEMRPDEPSVLSNLGMSYVLEGDLKTAEIYMRKATATAGADSRVRQNLALVVGLQGRFQEAEQIARSELSPEQAKANVSYLRSMLSQQNAWNQLEQEEKNTN